MHKCFIRKFYYRLSTKKSFNVIENISRAKQIVHTQPPTQTPDLSTDIPKPIDSHMADVIPFDEDEVDSQFDDIPAHIHHMHVNNDLPYQIHTSSDPFENTIKIEISTRGNHKTFGLITTINKVMGHRPQFIECRPSKPATRIPK